jgi:hypothetical protein
VVGGPDPNIVVLGTRNRSTRCRQQPSAETVHTVRVYSGGLAAGDNGHQQRHECVIHASLKIASSESRRLSAHLPSMYGARDLSCLLYTSQMSYSAVSLKKLWAQGRAKGVTNGPRLHVHLLTMYS